MSIPQLVPPPMPLDNDPLVDDFPDTYTPPPPDPCDALFGYRFRLTQSLKTFDIRLLSAWSGGGGPIWQLEADTGNPFAGRDYGSGDRKTIYGSRAYGSGYPDGSYPVPNPTTVAGRGFPYGLWPIYWAENYAGSAEYGLTTAELFRPGGELVQAPLRPAPARWNYTTVEEETYWLIGDQASMFSMLTNMVNWCDAEPKWPELFEPANNTIGVAGNNTNQGVIFHPGNVLQYYRASSFALAHPKYNNTYAHPPLNTSTLFTHDQSTPLNDVMKFSTWLKCINETIADALPILDAPPTATSSALDGGTIVGLVFGGIMGFIIVGAAVLPIWLGMCAMYDKKISRIRQKKQLARDRQRQIYEERKRADDFQNYP